MAELLAAELVQRHFPHRFEELWPSILLEHYIEERTPEGRRGGFGSPARNGSHLAIPTGSTCRSTRSKPCSAGRRRRLCRHRCRSPTIKPKVGAYASTRRGADVIAVPKVSRSPVRSPERVRGAAFVSVMSLRAGSLLFGSRPIENRKSKTDRSEIGTSIPRCATLAPHLQKRFPISL
jgi:hypothetical protein